MTALGEKEGVLAYIGLGANLGDPARQLQEALALLAAAGGVEVLRISGFYRNPPLGPQDQPWYVNAAAEVRTSLPALELLRLLGRIEDALGRVRGQKWGPRVIDLDLLLYGGETISGPELVVPHPGMHRQAFVLEPLAEIAAEARHPVLQKSVAELLAGLDPAARAPLQRLN